MFVFFFWQPVPSFVPYEVVNAENMDSKFWVLSRGLVGAWTWSGGAIFSFLGSMNYAMRLAIISWMLWHRTFRWWRGSWSPRPLLSSKNILWTWAKFDLPCLWALISCMLRQRSLWWWCYDMQIVRVGHLKWPRCLRGKTLLRLEVDNIGIQWDVVVPIGISSFSHFHISCWCQMFHRLSKSASSG